MEKLTVENGPNLKHVCSYCGKSYAFLSLLRSHERKHTGEKPFRCAFCDKCFAQRSGLAIHERRHTGVKPYSCHYCEKTFASPFFGETLSPIGWVLFDGVGEKSANI
ncbi:zinc finger, C2H2 type [Trichinella nativa]|uniref:Zinc finger, C2H2 type n=1 Tax=Trichinella nativa TaxID=6335 RepID=A0A1Y3EGP1_9BILA|nr:zinc finger, C2H2 type [Trichinella nativa]